MITLDEVLEKIIENSDVLGAVEVDLAGSLGYVIAEDVLSDIDMPPFDKSAMDGYAVRAGDLQNVPAKLEVIEEIAAGSVPGKALASGQCAAIMTGAMTPEGADTVVMIEDTRKDDDTGAVMIEKSVPKGENICRKGEDIRKGQTVIFTGQKIMPQHIGILASVGKTRVKVVRKPKFRIFTTGAEIVEAGQTPSAGQIRNSNGWSLSAQVTQAGYEANYSGIVSDKLDALTNAISQAGPDDIILLSGGVSMGQYDLVPQAVEDAGAEIIFHKILIKPGKPVLFAKLGDKLIFGVPGNPVSTLIGFETLILPAARKMAGEKNYFKPKVTARLVKDIKTKPGRLKLRHAKITYSDGEFQAEVVSTHGSADLLSTCASNGMVIIQPDTQSMKAGEKVEVILWDQWWSNQGLLPY
jgi:molybdopterin molybdotransferase